MSETTLSSLQKEITDAAKGIAAYLNDTSAPTECHLSDIKHKLTDMERRIANLLKPDDSDSIKMTIILKSGKEINVKCSEFTWEMNKSTGNIVSYEIKDIRGPIPKYLDMKEIAAIIRQD